MSIARSEIKMAPALLLGQPDKTSEVPNAPGQSVELVNYKDRSLSRFEHRQATRQAWTAAEDADVAVGGRDVVHHPEGIKKG